MSVHTDISAGMDSVIVLLFLGLADSRLKTMKILRPRVIRVLHLIAIKILPSRVK